MNAHQAALEATEVAAAGTTLSRIGRLIEQVMGRGGSFVADGNPFERDLALFRAGDGLSVVQKRAAMLRELVALATIEIHDDWHLAGEHLAHGCGFDGPDPQRQRLEALAVEHDKAGEIETCVRQWNARRRYPYAVGQPLPEQDGGVDPALLRSVIWPLGWIENHSIRDYAKVLRLGFAGIRQEVEARLAEADITDPDYARQENFWRAAFWVCDAGARLGRRYAELAGRLAGANDDPVEVQRLQRMAEACQHVPAQGARTFFEAVQALWLAHVLTCGEDGINANSIGRLDQILQPYYEADLAAGRISRDEAVELMAELACKLYLDYDVQAITIGGQNRTGDDAVNEMSWIILDATEQVGFVRDLMVRVGGKTPAPFVDRCAELVARGGGIPFFFNDDCFVDALVDHGIERADARDYAPIGCIELTIPGKANPHAVSGWFGLAKCLELALFDGRDPRTDQQLGPHTGALADFTCYDQLFDAFQEQVAFFARHLVYHVNRGELAQREGGPLPCWSVLTDDCIRRGRDITDGGAIYNYHSICLAGIANTADSLMAVRKLLFDEGRLTADELLAALRADFAGHEPLRQMLLRGAPKYGNDIAEVDQIAARVAADFIDLLDRCRSPLGGRYVVHLFSFLHNITFGQALGATPDGRLAGEPMAYSCSPQQGRDELGVTALLNSIARLPHRRAAGASAAIVDLAPKLIAGDAGAKRLGQLIRAGIKMGVGQMQFNVVNAERLQQARDCPEKYGNIPVRVAGYSQMFRLLSTELQDHVIARTKHEQF